MRIDPIEASGEVRTVVFSFDDKYARYFSVAFQSLVQNASKDYLYDIVILHDSVSEQTMRLLKGFAPEGFVLRFFDVGSYARETFGDLCAKVTSDQWNVSTYYDLLIPLLMPNHGRVLHVDSDLVFCDDPGELFEMPFDGAQLIAVRDSLSLSVQYSPENSFIAGQRAFAHDVIGLETLDECFNGGVLVFDIPAIDEREYRERTAQVLGMPNLPAVDQDALNYIFKGRAKLVSQRFNLQAHLIGELGDEPRGLAGEDEFRTAAQSPAIVHYTTHRKPWSHRSCPLSDMFWEYAKLSPYYRSLLYERELYDRMVRVATFSVRDYVVSGVLSKIIPGKLGKKYRDLFAWHKQQYLTIRKIL